MIKATKKYLFFVAATLCLATSCDKIDNHRIPAVSVNLVFNDIGTWGTYGVTEAGQYRRFIKSELQPAGYPYKANEYTGYGGVLLVYDPYGQVLAYDLACPVEVRPDIRVQLDTSHPNAGIFKCPKCGSTYDVFSGGGAVGGEALKMKYGLEPYFVAVGSMVPPYAVVKR